MDVCALFEDEVDRALEAGWAGAEVYLDAANAFVVDIATATANVPSGAALTLETESKSEARQFSTVWYDADGDGKPNNDLYADTDDLGADVDGLGQVDEDGNEDGAIITRDGLIIELLDTDGDPMHGDIGKIDRRKKASATAAKNSADGSDGTADNYSDGNEACSDDDGGDGCDAKVVIDMDYTFGSGTAFDCEVERTLAIECTWDAQGLLDIAATPANLTATNESSFLTCKVLK